jgi:hypothetical protein
VKNYLADHCDFSMSGLRERLPVAFSKVTGETIQAIMAKVIKQEQQYWSQDEALDEEYSADAQEEYAARKFQDDDVLTTHLLSA